MFPSRGGSRGQDAATVALELQNAQFNAALDQTEREWSESMRTMSREALKLELATERQIRTIKKFGTDGPQARRALVALKDAENDLIRSATKADQTINRQGRSFGTTARRMFLYTGGVYALSRAFTQTVRIAGDFERSMNVLEGVTSATAAQMAAARAEATRLGKDITLPATSAKDAADAMTTLAKAGLDVEQSIAGSEGVLRLAAAANIETAEAANITARSLNAFGIAAGESARVADVFAGAANSATGEIPDFALALSQSSNVAKAWNLSIEETVATLAVFANNAIIGSDAGTSLRVMLTRLVPVSVAARKKMEELGLSAFDAAGQIKPYRQILQEYHDVLVKLPPEQQKLAIQTIFGQDAQRAANVVLVKGIDAYDKMLTSVSKTGAAQEFAAARMKGYPGAVDAFRSSLETLQISLGEKLLPSLTRGFQAATRFINSMEESGGAASEAGKAMQDVELIVEGLAGGIKLATGALKPYVDMMGGLKNATEAALGIWLILRLRGVAAGLGLVRTRAFGAAAGFDAMAAAEGRAAGAASKMNPALIGAIAGFLAYPYLKQGAEEGLGADYQGPQASGDLMPVWNGKFYADPNTGLPAPNQKYWIERGKRLGLHGQTLNRHDPSSLRKGGRGGISPVPRPNTGSGDPGKPTDGLTKLDRLEIALSTAEANTPGNLQDDLRAQQAIVAYYKKIASNESLKGAALKQAKLDYLSAVKASNAIEEQIANEREQNAAEAARKRKERAAKLKRQQDKIAAADYKIAAERSNQLRKLYEKAVWRGDADGQWRLADPNKKTKKQDVVTPADLDHAIRDLLNGFNEIQRKYAPNFQLGTHVLEHLTREQTGVLRGISVGGARFRYSRDMAEQAEAVMS